MILSGKNILLIIHEGALGGAQRQALGLGRYLSAQCNCRVDVLLTFSDKTTQEFDDYLQACGIQNVLHFGTPYLLLKREFSIRNLKRLKWTTQYLLQLRKGLKPYQHEIIIPYLNFPSKIAYYLYKLLPKVEFTFWHQLGLDSLSLDVMESIAAKNTPCVIGNAPNCLEMFDSPYPRDKKHLHILPQFVTLDRIDWDTAAWRETFKIPQDCLVIGMIAHYRSDKYHDLLLDVFMRLKQAYPRIHLLFLGNKDNNAASLHKFDHLEQRIVENELSGCVSLLSSHEVQSVLSVLDIGALISFTEGTPNAVMEYMLYGLPVVASDHPGCKGLLQDSPFLVPNDPIVIYEKLSLLISSQQLRESEGHRNLERIKAYDEANYVKGLERIINQTLK